MMPTAWSLAPATVTLCSKRDFAHGIQLRFPRWGGVTYWARWQRRQEGPGDVVRKQGLPKSVQEECSLADT